MRAVFGPDRVGAFGREPLEDRVHIHGLFLTSAWDVSGGAAKFAQRAGSWVSFCALILPTLLPKPAAPASPSFIAICRLAVCGPAKCSHLCVRRTLSLGRWAALLQGA